MHAQHQYRRKNHNKSGDKNMKKWIIGVALPAVLPIWKEYKLRPVLPIDSAMRGRTIDALVAQLGAQYLFPEKATQITTLLRQRNGDYDAMTNCDQLAKTPTVDMASVTNDLHLRLAFSPEVLPLQARSPRGPRSNPEPGSRFMPWIDALGKQFALMGAQKVELMPSNIGYLEMSGFARPELSARKYAAAIRQAPWRAEERDDPDRGRHRIRRKGLRLHDAGAGGATLIGARTWGSAHPTGTFRLDDHFVAHIPNYRTISPITGTN